MVFIGLVPVFGIILTLIIIAAIAAAKQNERNDMSLKKAYLYLVSVISLIISVVGAIILLNMALKAWVFKKADQNYYSYPVCSQTKNPDGSVNQGCDPQLIAQQQKQDQENRAAQRQRDASQALAMIIVATPVWYYHWRMARKEA
jgi:glucan phosphoethanolaminetransferase (alkaline phosphatase superfamily)